MCTCNKEHLTREFLFTYLICAASQKLSGKKYQISRTQQQINPVKENLFVVQTRIVNSLRNLSRKTCSSVRGLNSSTFSDVDKVREIDNLDKEIRILQATNDQCTKENFELRKSISEMESQLKSSHDEVNEAQTNNGIARTKLVILQTKFIASLSSVMHRISGGGNLNYNTFESCVDILGDVFSQPGKNALLIRQVKEALGDFNI